ncbi:MAG: regulatory iron-sulfur-containing complex subunit RicT [Bacteroidota bacterium]
MGCGSCGTSGGCSPKGCKNNGTCGTTGCNKLNVYDWLSDVTLPEDYKPFNILEIRFKGSRKEFFKNTPNLELYTGDAVVVDSENGYDIGHVSVGGELVRLQMKKRGVAENSDQIKNIQRKASDKDLEKYVEAKNREAKILERARTVALELKLEMKLSDIEIQGDNRKVIFFYTAESRVDFRELIRRYADEFKLRIEMRQIGYRQEAARLGGIGSCGRELCCSTWLTDFKMVNTSVARYQNLSINMLKLSGQCGKLKCCLNFELDTYMDALEAFPKARTVKLDTVTGVAVMLKTDILKKLTWFAYDDRPNWICLPLDTVNEYIKLNEKGQKAPELIAEVVEVKYSEEGMGKAEGNIVDLAGDDITRMDNKKNKNKKGNNRPNNKFKAKDGSAKPSVPGHGSNTNKVDPKPKQNFNRNAGKGSQPNQQKK